MRVACRKKVFFSFFALTNSKMNQVALLTKYVEEEKKIRYGQTEKNRNYCIKTSGFAIFQGKND